MPAFNEEGLSEFLLEVDAVLRPAVARLTYVVVDDCSSTPVADDLRDLPGDLGARVQVMRNEHNLGHGPSALLAYEAGIASGAEAVLHVDGDGQFNGTDIVRVLARLDSAHAVIGARTGRTDPWFRRLVSRLAALLTASGDVPDANTPLRAYRPDALVGLLEAVPRTSLVPHLHFARNHPRLGIQPAVCEVTSRPRRGISDVGTTWGGGSVLPSPGLLWFCLRAAHELLTARRPSVAVVAPQIRATAA